jgi:hypothetical protein
MKTGLNYINGVWKASQSGKTLNHHNPADVGLTHVNIYTAYKEPQLSFGGVKFSRFGLPEAGHTGVEYFTEHKVAYIKYD